jgi:hypothetical protein
MTIPCVHVQSTLLPASFSQIYTLSNVDNLQIYIKAIFYCAWAHSQSQPTLMIWWNSLCFKVCWLCRESVLAQRTWLHVFEAGSVVGINHYSHLMFTHTHSVRPSNTRTNSTLSGPWWKTQSILTTSHLFIRKKVSCTSLIQTPLCETHSFTRH